MENDLHTAREVAALLRIKDQTLRRWRSEGRGPRFLRLGDPRRGRVRYARHDVAEWITARARDGAGTEV
jgi:predicted DNA-binding transcriptional regulator AlpA